MAVFWPTQGFKGRTFQSSQFSTEETLISASAVPYPGEGGGGGGGEEMRGERGKDKDEERVRSGAGENKLCRRWRSDKSCTECSVQHDLSLRNDDWSNLPPQSSHARKKPPLPESAVAHAAVDYFPLSKKTFCEQYVLFLVMHALKYPRWGTCTQKLKVPLWWWVRAVQDYLLVTI